MKIFLTGGTGFNGSHLIKELVKQGDQILALTRNKNYKFHKEVQQLMGDLSNTSKWEKELKEFSPDVAIHLAWDGIPKDYSPRMSAVNIRNSLNLMVLLTDINCPKIISVGTCWEYGMEIGKLDESMLPKPKKPIAIAKESLYRISKELTEEKGIILIWPRLFYVYGPGRADTTLIQSIANSIIAGDVPKIRNPDNYFDFIYVGDVATAISELARNNVQSGIYNIGSGQSISLKYVAETIYKILGKEFKQEPFSSEFSKKSNFWADISKIKQEVGWEPKTNIEDGISKTIQWLRR